MKTLLKTIAEALVDSPDQVAIKEIKSEKTVIFEIRVASDDVGKLIGKNGKTVLAIRTILNGWPLN